MTTTAARPPVERPARRPRSAVPLLAVGTLASAAALVALLAATGEGPEVVAPGLPTPGALTGWGLPLATLLLDLSAALAVGGALLAAVLAPGPGDELSPAGHRGLRTAWRAACIAAVASLAVLLLQMSDVIGAPLGEIASAEVLVSYLRSFPDGRAALVSCALALTVAAAARTALSRAGAVTALLLAVVTTLPFALTGHAAGGRDHDLATSSLVVHVVAVSLWTGGLAALLLHGRRAGHAAPGLVERFSSLALWAFIAVALSGVANALTRLSAPSDLWSSAYGREVALKSSMLVALGGAGAWHRARALPALARGDDRSLWRLCGGEVLLMAMAFGTAVALSRTEPPADEVATTASSSAVELGYDVPRPDLAGLLTAWRLDVLVLLLVAAAGVAYAHGVRSLRAQGHAWPRVRTACFACGLTVTAFALAGGPATYAMAVLQVHVGQHLALSLVAPALLVAGAPVALATRTLPTAAAGEAHGLRELVSTAADHPVAAAVRHPAVAVLCYGLLVWAVYLPPLFGTSTRAHWVHLLGALAALAGGLVLWQRVVFTHRSRPLLLGAAAVHLVVAAGLWRGGLLAPEWFLALQVPGADLARGQEQAAVVVLAVGALLGLAGVAGRTRGHQRAMMSS